MDTDHTARIAASSMTVSDKIRALAAAGHPRADIARALGKRYQHVRNVLEADLQGASRSTVAPMPEVVALMAGVEEPSRAFVSRGPHSPDEVEDRGDGVFRLAVRADGSVMMPVAVLEALGAAPGSALIAQLRDDEFSLINGLTALRRAQEMLRPSMTEGVSWADALIADRRRDAAREEADG